MGKGIDDHAQSADIIAENIQQLKGLFPEAFTEDGVHFDVLRQLLGDADVLAEGEEKYGLNWHGKKQARQIALTPSTGTLRPCPEESVDWDTTQNLFIEGDNLEVLKLLQKSYANKVKMIYIDPPYNTGKEFIYPDNYQDNLDTYLKYTGQVDNEGMKFSSNTETSGRKHTNWLNMMYPRLKLARNLLKKDGVIFISIDDNEVHRLISLCSEIFGEENFVAQLAVQLNPRGRNLDKFVAKTHESVLVFVKDYMDENSIFGIEKEGRMINEYNKEDENGKYRLIGLRNRNQAFNPLTRPNLYYPLYVEESTGKVSLIKNQTHIDEIFPDAPNGVQTCWTWSKEKTIKNNNLLIALKTSDEWRVYRKDYLLGKDGKVATTLVKSIWLDKEINNDYGKKIIKNLFGNSIMTFPKAIELITKLIQIGMKKEDIFLDFFSGSATSAHAIISLNKKDKGKRQHISIQLPELTNEKTEAYKAGYKTIADIGKERIRRAAKKIKQENPNYQGDLGFKVFKLASSNIKAWNPDYTDLEKTLFNHQEHLVAGRTEQDVLYELLLKRGVDLTVPIEEQVFNQKTVYSIGYGALFACLDKSLNNDAIETVSQGIITWHQELAPASDTQVFFRDSAFANDITKSNMVAILEQSGIAHVRCL